MAKGELANPLITNRSITRLYGKRLRKGREKTGLDQKTAAERLGISQPSLSRMERGEAQPDFQTFYKMGELYGCKASELMPRNQYPSAPLDPLERRLYFIERNALIQGVDPDEALAMITERSSRLVEAREAKLD